MTDKFSERLALVTKRNTKVKHKPGQHWPLAKRMEVVQQWLILGNLRQVAAITGVGYQLIKEWRGRPWWQEIEKELRSSENIQMDNKLTQIVEKSLEATLDRVENGDFIYDQKTGEIRRKPANLRDVHRVAVDTLDRREVIRGGQEQRKENVQISMEEQLKQLAMNMAQWFEKETKPVIELNEEDVTDVTEKEDDDAFHEEWEEGLQEGGGPVHEQAGGDQEEDGSECGETGSDEGRIG